MARDAAVDPEFRGTVPMLAHVAAGRLVRVAVTGDAAEHVHEVGERLAMRRHEREHRSILLLRVRVRACVEQREAQVVQQARMIGAPRKRLPIGVHRLGETPLFTQQIAEMETRVDISVVARDRSPQCRLRRGRIGAPQCYAEDTPRVGIPIVKAQRVASQRRGERVAAAAQCVARGLEALLRFARHAGRTTGLRGPGRRLR